MLFVETPLFTADVEAWLSRDEYRTLQLALLLRPDAGKVIPKSGGLRKLRWRQAGRGKRGGARIVYYWMNQEKVIYLLTMYRKTKQSDLTPKQLRILRTLVQEHLR